MTLAQNELNLFDNPWNLLTREGETIKFLTIDGIESGERFKIESLLDNEE